MTLLPIVERELRVAARHPSTSLLRFLVALVGIILCLGLWGARHTRTTPADIGGKLFVALGVLLFMWCALAGVFLTADSLSSEKREGTLGLLFLTDLRGHDIVLGKLASTSLRSVSAVLALLPVLALPLLLGGVTAGEFWRVVLALLVTLFLSLTCGLFMSAITRQSPAGMGGTFLFLFFTNAVLPLWYYLLLDFRPPGLKRLLLWPSQTFLFTSAWNRYDYWYCVISSIAMATLFLIGASLLLPLVWRDRSESAQKQRRPAPKLGNWTNPYCWLARRGQAPSLLVWGLIVVGALISVAFLLEAHQSIVKGARPGWSFAISLLTAFGAHQLFKYMVASEASRCFSEDRRNGTMELLLVSPLSPASIIRGQRQALASLLRMPAWTLIALNMFLILAHKLTTPFGPQFETWTLVLTAGMALVAADYYGLSWTGMWLGLRGRRHHRAVLGTLLRVMVPPWAVAFLLFAGLGRGALSFEEMLICWLFLGAAVSLMVGQFAQLQLRSHFRTLARAEEPRSFGDRRDIIRSRSFRLTRLREDTA
jgi:ABC-type transport system involved in cytochrome c biogenesis permease component